MKKSMISFFILLFLIIVSITLFIILYSGSKKVDQETSLETSDLSPTPATTLSVTPAVSPTAAPVPTVVPADVTELYPAYQTADKENTYGYIDKTGKFVIDPSFQSASDFHDGVAVVKLNDKYCVIDEKGSVIYINDNPIEDFSNGAAVISSGNDKLSYGYIDTMGKVIIEPQYVMAASFGNDNTAYVSTGKGK
jgi:hypothetical protein